MSATHSPDRTTAAPSSLYLAFELGWSTWGLAFSTAPAQPPRRVTIPARDLDALQREIHRAQHRFALADDTPVRSCYEAGRDGFWLHRYLTAQGIANVVVDAASIEINRRARHAKSDGIDVAKLLNMLIRYHSGERGLWSVVKVPTPADEDRRQPHRDRLQLVRERTEHVNRIKGFSPISVSISSWMSSCPTDSIDCGNGMAQRSRANGGAGSTGSSCAGGR